MIYYTNETTNAVKVYSKCGDYSMNNCTLIVKFNMRQSGYSSASL